MPKPYLNAIRLLAAAALLLAAAARAGQPFDAALAAAQASGKPVLVHVNASWCTTCAQQRAVLSELLKRPEFRDFQVLKVDFDTQKADLKTLRVRDRSTIIVYRGSKELGRSSFETSREKIAALLEKAVHG
jgi:thiol-disulfide isomerase/thioredoxin